MTTVTSQGERLRVAERRSPLQLALRRFRRNRVGVLSFWVLAFMYLVALFAPFLAPKDPLQANFRMMGKPPGELAWFGTDQIGYDVFSRIIYGARISLVIGFVATLIAMVIGLLLGALAGFFGGAPDGDATLPLDVAE